MSTAELATIVLSALGTMEKRKQIDFIAKHIDAWISLTRLGANRPKAFLDEVETLCMDCLNKAHYSDEDDVETYFSENAYDSSYYDEDWDYAEYYRNTEWAKAFTKLFKLSMMYIQSGDISTGYEACARLLSCLGEMISNSGYLGTDEPMEYISVDWDELFALHYGALFQYHTDTEHAIEDAFRCWVDFGDPCTEGFLSNVKDIAAAERFILDGLKEAPDWRDQRRCFELLAQLHRRLRLDFDKVSLAEKLIEYNVYFYLFVVEGLYEQERWQLAVETAHKALKRVPILASDTTDRIRQYTRQKIRAAIQAMLVNSYEKLSDFAQAFETAKCMFLEAPDFDLYKQARVLAEKGGDVSAFLTLVENHLSQPGFNYMSRTLLRDIYSYEGEIQKLIKRILSQKIDQNYYDRKYTALSLIYRAVNGMENIGENLSEYLASPSNQSGIVDMLRLDSDAAHRTELLTLGANLLREIIAFHIGAASRSRYAKAAYYMCVMRDIYIYLDREKEFQHDFRDLIMQNSRRPALRDEMGIVYGKAATAIKK
jgi:hypothetical protein